MPFSSSNQRVSSRLSLILGMGVLVFGLTLLATPATGQALRPGIDLTRPAHGTSNLLNHLRNLSATEAKPKIVLVYPQKTIDHRPDAEERVELAVRNWELMLLGLHLPYELVYDEEFGRSSVRNKQLLILPASDVMSSGQWGTVRRFIEDGGSVIASGQTGIFTEGGDLHTTNYFQQVFGAEYMTNLPTQATGILHGTGGGHAVIDGLLMGFRLNLSPQLPTTAARPLKAFETEREVLSTAIGRPYPYNPLPVDADPFTETTMMLYGELGAGRFMWFRFNPQDVSPDTEQQEVYQGLIINTLSYLTRTPSMAIAPWPQGMQSATVIASLPSVGFDALRYQPSLHNALTALEAANAPATFFLVTEKATAFRSLLDRMNSIGEIAISSVTDDALVNRFLEQQSERIGRALDEAQPFSSRQIVGIYPPGGFYEINTIRAMFDNGIRYLIIPPPTSSAAPRFLRWFDASDYRDGLPRLYGNNTALALQSGDGLFTPEQRNVDASLLPSWMIANPEKPDRTVSDVDPRYEIGDRRRPATAGTLIRGGEQVEEEDPIQWAERRRRREMAEARRDTSRIELPTSGERQISQTGRPLPSWMETAPETPDVWSEAEQAVAQIDEDGEIIYRELPTPPPPQPEGGIRALTYDELVPLQDRILTFPMISRDDFAIVVGEKTGGNPEAQFNLYVDDWETFHEFAGLYILPFHADVQALTPTRAAVLTQFANYVRENKSWLATFRDVYDWWLLRQQAEVELLEVSEDRKRIMFEVKNQTTEGINGLTLNLRLDFIPGGQPIVTGTQGIVTIAENEPTLNIILPIVRAGVNRMVIEFRDRDDEIFDNTASNTN